MKTLKTYPLPFVSEKKSESSKKSGPSLVEYEIPYLGAEDVIDEVITLLAKLENDRRETKKTLKDEKKRTEMLSSKIDNLSEQRLQALPEAVQKGKMSFEPCC